MAMRGNDDLIFPPSTAVVFLIDFRGKRAVTMSRGVQQGVRRSGRCRIGVQNASEIVVTAGLATDWIRWKCVCPTFVLLGSCSSLCIPLAT